ncbi:IclR family transcriptional regulator [Cohaesibacter gelatinilyticus]|uniref:Transcriptional regulator, IclR family n=1 Tax=Cohaesibacter gelatinilyticus TaxID=372072 RepID=A0A285PIQ9_9HYPH|nr:helix-turn-helix domain-containing protein [Cohaesibacter gelatinilyticus]SNZ21137.1 transcriptional regulator, IclR family [Cohaesibacter gelatinilyticus]
MSLTLNRSVLRAMDILNVIAEHGPSSLAALAVRTGLPKATILRLCATMESQRWLVRRTGDGVYQIGSGMPGQGQKVAGFDLLVENAKDIILDLSQKTGLAVDLASDLGNGRIEIIDTTRSFDTHGIYPYCIGFRPSPFCSALGLAFLVALPQEDLKAALKDLSKHAMKTELPAVHRFDVLVRQIRANGYAQREKGHWGRAVDYGVIPAAIAVPIIQDGRPIGALNLVWAEKNFAIDNVVNEYLTDLTAAAHRIALKSNVVGRL